MIIEEGIGFEINVYIFKFIYIFVGVVERFFYYCEFFRCFKLGFYFCRVISTGKTYYGVAGYFICKDSVVGIFIKLLEYGRGVYVNFDNILVCFRKYF